MHISFKNVRQLSAEQISTRVLYVLLAVIVLLFGAFFLVGYDTPFEDDPTFNAPLFTDAVLVFIYILTAATVALTACAVYRSIRGRDKTADTINNIPAAKIVWLTTGLTAASLVLTFLFGSSEPVDINGVKYSDVFWLKATDMFINTALILLFIAVCGVVFGLSGYNRKIYLKNEIHHKQ